MTFLRPALPTRNIATFEQASAPPYPHQSFPETIATQTSVIFTIAPENKTPYDLDELNELSLVLHCGFKPGQVDSVPFGLIRHCQEDLHLVCERPVGE